MCHETNLGWHEASVCLELREQKNAHKDSVTRFTGASGLGKPTVVNTLDSPKLILLIAGKITDKFCISHDEGLQ